jgi:hypothetical protein
VLRSPLTEHTTSLRAARLDRVPEGLVETIASEGYGFFLECATRFVRAGLNVVEIPIHFHERKHGRSKISQIEIVRGALNLVRLRLRRTWENAALGESAQRCTACNEPFVTRMPAGELRCLACAHCETPAANLGRVHGDLSEGALQAVSVGGNSRRYPSPLASTDTSGTDRGRE